MQLSFFSQLSSIIEPTRSSCVYRAIRASRYKIYTSIFLPSSPALATPLPSSHPIDKRNMPPICPFCTPLLLSSYGIHPYVTRTTQSSQASRAQDTRRPKNLHIKISPFHSLQTLAQRHNSLTYSKPSSTKKSAKSGVGRDGCSQLLTSSRM